MVFGMGVGESVNEGECLLTCEREPEGEGTRLELWGGNLAVRGSRARRVGPRLLRGWCPTVLPEGDAPSFPDNLAFASFFPVNATCHKQKFSMQDGYSDISPTCQKGNASFSGRSPTQASIETCSSRWGGYRTTPGRCRKTPLLAPIQTFYCGRSPNDSKPFQRGCRKPAQSAIQPPRSRGKRTLTREAASS